MNSNIHQRGWQQFEKEYIPFVYRSFKSLPYATNPTNLLVSYSRILNSCAYMMAIFINYEQFGTSYYIDADNQPNSF